MLIPILATLTAIAVIASAFQAGIQWERRRLEARDAFLGERLQSAAEGLEAAFLATLPAEPLAPREQERAYLAQTAAVNEKPI